MPPNIWQSTLWLGTPRGEYAHDDTEREGVYLIFGTYHRFQTFVQRKKSSDQLIDAARLILLFVATLSSETIAVLNSVQNAKT